MTKRVVLFTMFFAAVLGRGVNAQFARPDSGTAVYLVTAGSGADALSWFGHSALVVADGNLRLDFWYDYGIIDPANNSLRDEFVGRIRASVIRRTNPQSRLKALEAEDRSVLVQQLMLTREQRDTIVHLLDEDFSRLGEKGYAYSHHTDNCTTRIRDMIDRATGGHFAQATATIRAKLTAREYGNQLIAVHNVPVDLVANWVSGRLLDVPLSLWDESYLPERLAASVAKVSLSAGRPLGVERYRHNSKRRYDLVNVPEYRLPYFIIGLLMGNAALILGCATRSSNRITRRSASTLLGICSGLAALFAGSLGVLIAVGWGFTQYTMTWSNENILLANPLILALVPVSMVYGRRSPRAVRFLFAGWLICTTSSLTLLLLKSSVAFYQNNWGEIALMTPLTAGLAAAFFIARPASGRTARAG